MANVTLKGAEVHLDGSFLKTGDLAPDFILVNADLKTVTLESFKDKKKVIATVPSIDTPVCAMETKTINDLATKNPEALFLVISKDLPFSQKRYCSQEDLHNVLLLSDIRPKSNFGKDFGVLISSGPLEGLLARSVIVLSEQDKVLYSELVPEITDTPDLPRAVEYLVPMDG